MNAPTKALHAALISAATAYDRKQSAKPHFNIWALPQYFERIDQVCADIDRGAPIRAAIVAGFDGRLANALLKAAQQSGYTLEDARGGAVYQPVTPTV